MATADPSIASQIPSLARWPAIAFGGLGQSERNLWSAALLVLVLILGFEAIRWAEISFVAPAGKGVVENAAEASTRFFTIPHVIIGFLFMITSTRNQTVHKRLWIVGLLGVGAVLSCAYGGMLSNGGKLLGAAFLYSYFLVHELRDEMNFYRLLDGSPQLADDKNFKHFGRQQIALLVGGVVFILWVSGTMRTPSVLALPGVSFAGMAGIVVMGAIVGILAMAASYRSYAARRGTSILQVIRDHRQLIRLYVAIFVLTIVGAILTDRLYPIILMHVSVWYVVTCRMLKQKSATGTTVGTWPWMRGTLNGFRTLHIGLAMVCMLLGALAVYAAGPLDHVWWFISPEAFPYWTIMHISVSFVPR